MEHLRKVLLYGDTLVLAGLRASLASYAGLDITEFTLPAASEEDVLALQPDVVIFDVEAVQPAMLHALTVKLPDVLIVGVDPSCNRVFVWSRRQLRELSTSLLVDVIEQFFTQAPLSGTEEA